MSVADQINEMKRAHERSVRIQEIQSLLYDWNRIDPILYGDLVLEVRAIFQNDLILGLVVKIALLKIVVLKICIFELIYNLFQSLDDLFSSAMCNYVSHI